MRQLYPNWRDELANLAYPFADVSELRSHLGQSLPHRCILDAAICPAGGTGGYYLAQIAITDDDISVQIGDEGRGISASGQWLPDNDVITLFDLLGRRAGVLTVDPVALAEVKADWGVGEFDFAKDDAQFVPSTWVPVFDTDDDSGAEGIAITSTELLYLVGGQGIRLECEEKEDHTLVTVHAIGDPLARRASCDGQIDFPPPIKTVVFQQGNQTHECAVDSSGMINMFVASKEGSQSSLRLDRTQHRLRFAFYAKPQ